MYYCILLGLCRSCAPRFFIVHQSLRHLFHVLYLLCVCNLCPLFCCCLYILYVIASLCICNCLCLCTFFFVLAPYTNLHVFLYTHLHVVVCKIFCACLCLSTCFCALVTLHVFVCTPSQMVTLCLFWCPVNTRTLDDCRFSFPWVQVSVSQTTEYCLYCDLLPCTH